VIPHRAYGYSTRESELQWVHSDLSNTGDGGVWCCVDDFVKWDAELRDPKLLDAERLDRAMTSGKLDDGSETGYGFGWAVGRDGSEPIAEHSGGWFGFVSHHLRLRDSELTVIVLCNLADGSIRPERLAHRIVDLYRKETGGE
jgi:CubicO group peptidase (beta-lactamase class C family)